MPTYTPQTRPSSTMTKQARPTSPKAGRFGIGTFGNARFGTTDGFSKQARTSTTMTKQARPT